MKQEIGILTLAVLFCSSIDSSMGKRVIFLPLTVTSHEMIHQTVAQEVSLLGHDVWMGVSTAFEKKFKPNSTIGVNFFNFDDFLEETEDKILWHTQNSIDVANGKEPDWTWIDEYLFVINEAYMKAMGENGLLDFVRKLNPDLIVIDFNPSINDLVAIPYALGVPFAILSPLYDATVARQPSNPLEDAMNSLDFQESNSLYKKLAMVLGLMYPLFHNTFYDTGFVGRIAHDKPFITAVDVLCQAEVYIIESNHLLDFPKPVLPNVKFVGGITSRPAKPLQEPFKTFMDNSHMGVVVVSFGSLIKKFPTKINEKLIEVFKGLKVDVIWSGNIVSPFPDKLMISPWIPQNDLLAHKNTRLFVSHCGMHGQMEAIYHGVPVVCLPIFFDQFYNAERFKAKTFGLTGNVWTDSAESLSKLILEVMNGEKYRLTISKASEIYHQLYKNPRKEAAFWLDHVMTHGGSHMRSNTQKIPMYQFTFVYFLFILIGVFLTVLLILIACVMLAVYLYCRRSGRKKRDLNLKVD